MTTFLTTYDLIMKFIQRGASICLFLLLPLILSLPSLAQRLDQPIHSRILIGDSWTGSYITGFYGKDLGIVRIEFCDEVTKRCNYIAHDIPFEKIEQFQEELIASLHAFRKQLIEEYDTSPWKFFTGGSSQSRDIKALNIFMDDLEQVGLKYWVFQTEQNMQRMPPDMTYPSSLKRLVEIMTRTFNKTSFENSSQKR